MDKKQKVKTVIKGLGFCSAGVGSCVCTIDVDEQQDKIVRIRPFRFDEKYSPEELHPWKLSAHGKELECGLKTYSSPLSLCYKNRVYSKNRIPYPMKREDWNPEGERNPQNRGKSRFIRISWDEALDIVAKELIRIKEHYGPESILAQADGHGETKVVHGTHGCQTRLLSLLGGYTLQSRQPDSWEGWYWGAKHIWGMDPFGQQNYQVNVIKDVAENGDAVLFWGCDPETTPWGWSGQMASRICYWFTDIGIKAIHISPDVNYTNGIHADTWIPVLPNTDAALQLAIAYVWITEGTYDQAYLETHAVGFDHFKHYVLGGEEGIAKTPKWAEKKCGVPSFTIKALARYWAQHAVSIAHCNGGSYIRSAFSHEPARLEVALLGMQGLGKPGANQFKFIDWSVFGIADVNALVTQSEQPDLFPAYRGRENPIRPDIIPKTMIPQAILHPPIQWHGNIAAGLPREDQFTGPYVYPKPGKSPIHMIWTDSPCWETCWNGGFKMQEAFRHESIETIVAQHIWMENDCRFADVILPTNTKLENVDIGSDAESGQWNTVYYEKQAIQPLFESVSDMEVVALVAKRLEAFGGEYEGIYERYTQGKEVEDFIRLGFENTGAAKVMDFAEFKEKEYYPFPAAKDWQDLPVGLSRFYEDPDAQPLLTPSGKLEYYSTSLAYYFPDDEERGPVPRWVEESAEHKERISSKRACEYPFLLVSNHPRWRIHANHDDAIWLREIDGCKVKGPDGYCYEPVWVNPLDAGMLGLKSGDIARIFNERGSVLGGVMVTERIMRGAIYQDHGARVDSITIGFDGLDRGGANNLIAPNDITSKYSYGEVTSGFLVNIEKFDILKLNSEHPVQHGHGYDAEAGLVFDLTEEGGLQ
jgi:trimethylamine-N-oxide reductase (cytochrome c)